MTPLWLNMATKPRSEAGGGDDEPTPRYEPTSQDHESSLNLLTIPPELRLLIYNFILTPASLKPPTKPAIFSGLMRICRFVRAEARLAYRVHLVFAITSLQERHSKANLEGLEAYRRSSLTQAMRLTTRGDGREDGEGDAVSILRERAAERVKLKRWESQVGMLLQEL